MTNETNGIRNDHHLISPTAKLVAYVRTMSDLPYAKDISEAVGAEVVSQRLGKDLANFTYFMSTMAESRYKGINRELEREFVRSGCRNVLELVAGISPRGLTLTADPRVKYVATDLPGMIGESEKVLSEVMKRNGLQRPNLYFRPANVLDLGQLNEAIKHFNGEPFHVVCEGLYVYFLEGIERDTVTRHIRNLTSQHNGVWVTSDIVDKANQKTQWAQFPPAFATSMHRMLDKVKDMAGGRDMRENFFNTPEEKKEYFRSQGFDFEITPCYDESYAFVSPRTIPDQDLRAKLVQYMRSLEIWTLRPKRK